MTDWSPVRVVLKPPGLDADNPAVDRSTHVRGDRGDIVLGWLTRLTVALAVLGVIGFDLVALGVGRLQAEDHAQAAARAAAKSWSSTQDLQTSYEAALAQVAEDAGPSATVLPEGFAVATDGAVTLTVEHTAATLLVEKIGPARSWATSRTTVTGRPPA